MKRSFSDRLMARWGDESPDMTKDRLESGARLLLETGDLPVGQGDHYSIWDLAVDLFIAYKKKEEDK